MVVFQADAASITLTATADTTLHELFPENNFGAYSHVNIGSIGTLKPGSSAPFATRGLYRFDLAQRIPAAARISSVQLVLTVTFGFQYPPTGYQLHRVLRAWNEGTKHNVGSNSGEPATLGETTWAYPWSAPGGAASVDFAQRPSATAPVTEGVVRYTFGSNGELIADVQEWVDHPEKNFGWLVISQPENLAQSARRFGSREDTKPNIPTLLIEYVAPVAELRIDNVARSGSKLTLTWSGGAPPYRLQRKSTLVDAIWRDVGSAIADSTITVPTDSSREFFRVVAP